MFKEQKEGHYKKQRGCEWSHSPVSLFYCNFCSIKYDITSASVGTCQPLVEPSDFFAKLRRFRIIVAVEPGHPVDILEGSLRRCDPIDLNLKYIALKEFVSGIFRIGFIGDPADKDILLMKASDKTAWYYMSQNFNKYFQNTQPVQLISGL